MRPLEYDRARDRLCSLPNLDGLPREHIGRLRRHIRSGIAHCQICPRERQRGRKVLTAPVKKILGAIVEVFVGLESSFTFLRCRASQIFNQTS